MTDAEFPLLTNETQAHVQRAMRHAVMPAICFENESLLPMSPSDHTKLIPQLSKDGKMNNGVRKLHVIECHSYRDKEITDTKCISPPTRFCRSVKDSQSLPSVSRSVLNPTDQEVQPIFANSSMHSFIETVSSCSGEKEFFLNSANIPNKKRKKDSLHQCISKPLVKMTGFSKLLDKKPTEMLFNRNPLLLDNSTFKNKDSSCSTITRSSERCKNKTRVQLPGVACNADVNELTHNLCSKHGEESSLAKDVGGDFNRFVEMNTEIGCTIDYVTPHKKTRKTADRPIVLTGEKYSEEPETVMNLRSRGSVTTLLQPVAFTDEDGITFKNDKEASEEVTNCGAKSSVDDASNSCSTPFGEILINIEKEARHVTFTPDQSNIITDIQEGTFHRDGLQELVQNTSVNSCHNQTTTYEQYLQSSSTVLPCTSKCQDVVSLKHDQYIIMEYEQQFRSDAQVNYLELQSELESDSESLPVNTNIYLGLLHDQEFQILTLDCQNIPSQILSAPACNETYEFREHIDNVENCNEEGIRADRTKRPYYPEVNSSTIDASVISEIRKEENLGLQECELYEFMPFDLECSPVTITIGEGCDVTDIDPHGALGSEKLGTDCSALGTVAKHVISGCAECPDHSYCIPQKCNREVIPQKSIDEVVLQTEENFLTDLEIQRDLVDCVLGFTECVSSDAISHLTFIAAAASDSKDICHTFFPEPIASASATRLSVAKISTHLTNATAVHETNDASAVVTAKTTAVVTAKSTAVITKTTTCRTNCKVSITNNPTHQTKDTPTNETKGTDSVIKSSKDNVANLPSSKVKVIRLAPFASAATSPSVTPKSLNSVLMLGDSLTSKIALRNNRALRESEGVRVQFLNYYRTSVFYSECNLDF